MDRPVARRALATVTWGDTLCPRSPVTGCVTVISHGGHGRGDHLAVTRGRGGEEKEGVVTAQLAFPTPAKCAIAKATPVIARPRRDD